MDLLAEADLNRYMNLALTLAEEGGAVLKDFWGNVRNIRNKEIVGDLVTEADKESEKKMLAILKQEYSSHAILAEESGASSSGSEEFLWVIDPLDGTINYAHQYPFVAVSIALLYKGFPVVGVVFNPILNELYQACRGKGAWLNNTSIHISNTRQLEQSLLTTGFAYDRRQNRENNYAEFCHLTNLSRGVRRGGSAALDLAFVAAGRCDGYWERGIKAWDIAAGTLLVLEAGGRVSTYDGSPLNFFEGRILATNGFLHEAVSRELIKIRDEREKNDRPLSKLASLGRIEGF